MHATPQVRFLDMGCLSLLQVSFETVSLFCRSHLTELVSFIGLFWFIYVSFDVFAAPQEHSVSYLLCHIKLGLFCWSLLT